MAERARALRTADGTLALSGELDAFGAAVVDEALATLTGSEARVDVSGVTFVDSACLRVLVRHGERLAADGHRLHLVDASASLRRLLELSGLDPAFVLDDTGDR